MNHRRGRLFVAPTAVGLALALAACGSSTKPLNANASNGYSQALKFANCMRAHGVPNYPDPSAGGGPKISPLPDASQAPAFQSAQKACGQGPGGGGPPAMSESRRRAAVAFAKCMRAHGESDFPDPTFAAPSGTTRILSLRGMLFAFSSGMDPRSPAFRQAAAACGLRLPSPGQTPQSAP